ncbi:hypothetical protein LIER_14083 [Lithospermum erythrorhizon]|uniref:Retrotransposon gag domain-containing protein n=1 Tax=Lithospermum erythrorhizon TaxID=34254 RepID=A0AAV3PXR2_LITER
MTKMSFTGRLDSIALPNGFKLTQFNLFDGNGDPLKHLEGFIAHMTITSNNLDVYAMADVFVAKFGTAIQTMQDERILMDIKLSTNESLNSYHKRYNDLLLNIPAIDDKVAYMAFFNGLAYGKLKKALLLKTPLSKDALIKEVKQHIELEELKKKATEATDLRETMLKKEIPRSPRRPLV